MRKKEYQKPDMRVHLMMKRAPLLLKSGGGGQGGALSRGFSSPLKENVVENVDEIDP